MDWNYVTFKSVILQLREYGCVEHLVESMIARITIRAYYFHAKHKKSKSSYLRGTTVLFTPESCVLRSTGKAT